MVLQWLIKNYCWKYEIIFNHYTGGGKNLNVTLASKNPNLILIIRVNSSLFWVLNILPFILNLMVKRQELIFKKSARKKVIYRGQTASIWIFD